MSEYRKEVEVFHTGMVMAKVVRQDGRCVGMEHYSSALFESNKKVEKRCKKAHAWADERIKVCERQETK